MARVTMTTDKMLTWATLAAVAVFFILTIYQQQQKEQQMATIQRQVEGIARTVRGDGVDL